MRRLFVVLIAATVVLSLAGCGGDEPPADAATGTDAPANPAGDAPAVPAADEEEPVVDDSPDVGGYPAPFPTDQQIVPQDILNRLEAGQPLLIYYFDKGHTVVDDMNREIDTVMDQYRGIIHKIEYGVATDMEDVVEYDDTLGADLPEKERIELGKVYRLAEELGIGYTPFLILVDREGTITWMHRGFVDADTLELRVLYATQ